MTHPFISLLMPSRGRPDLVDRFIKSLITNTADIDCVEIIFYVDEDDVGSYHIGSKDVSFKRIIGPRASMGAYNTACYAAAKGDIIILVNDDMIIGTLGWDTRVIDFHASIPDKIYLAYGNDLFKKKNLCAFPIMSRRTCELLINPFPKEYQGAFIDSHLWDIFMRLQYAGYNRFYYMEDLIFEHLHYRTGKAVFDETYSNRPRFIDDIVFISLINCRKKAADFLLSLIRCDEDHIVYHPEACVIEESPKNLARAIIKYTDVFLFDSSLSLRWRSYLWTWFIGRYMAGRGMLWPFVR